MKHVLSILLFSMCGLFVSCRQTQTSPAYSKFELEQRGELWYKKGKDKPFSGTYHKEILADSNVSEETQYENGALVLQKIYYTSFNKPQLKALTREWGKDPNGELYIRDYIQYSDHSEEKIEKTITYQGTQGVETAWFPDGELQYVRELSEGRPHGKYIEYCDKGWLKLESQWEQGQLKGHAIEKKYYGRDIVSEEWYYETWPSSFSYSGPYLDRGFYKTYYRSGKLSAEGEWSPETGRISRTYSPQGKLIAEMSTPGKPAIDMIRKEYDPDTGKLKQEIVRQAGKITFQRIYYKDGSLESEYDHGIGKEYYKNGICMSEKVYDDNDQHIRRKAWYRNGQLMFELNLAEEKLHGIQVRYHENGNLQARINFNSDRISDTSVKTYHSNGSLQGYLTFDSSGNPREGQIFYPDGRLFVERVIQEDQAPPLVNIIIYEENQIFNEDHHSHYHRDNTPLLPYLLLDDNPYMYRFYFEEGQPFTEMEEAEPSTDCNCGPAASDISNYEYLYENNKASGTLKSYSMEHGVSAEINFFEGKLHGRYMVRMHDANTLYTTTYHKGEEINPKEER